MVSSSSSFVFKLQCTELGFGQRIQNKDIQLLQLLLIRNDHQADIWINPCITWDCSADVLLEQPLVRDYFLVILWYS